MILSGNPHKPTHTYTLVVKPAIHIIVHKFIYNIWLNNTLLKKDNCRLGQHHLFSWIFGSSSTSRYKHIFFKARHEVFQFRTCGNPRFCQITRRQLKVELDIVENLLISSGHIFSYWDPWDWYIYLHQSHGSHGFCKINTTSGIGHSGLCEVYLQQRSSKIESLVQWVVIEYLYRFKYGTIYLNHDILGSFPPNKTNYTNWPLYSFTCPSILPWRDVKNIPRMMMFGGWNEYLEVQFTHLLNLRSLYINGHRAPINGRLNK